MSTPKLPKEVTFALEALNASENKIVLSYIAALLKRLNELGCEDYGMATTAKTTSTSTTDPMGMDDDDDKGKEEFSDVYVAPQFDPSTQEEDYDYDEAATAKQNAADCKADGNYQQALEYYNQAILAAPPSALLYANRAMVLEELGPQYYPAAKLDCDLALELNPDSAKALKARGTLFCKHFKQGKNNKDPHWHQALKDLSQSQSIDFDPDVATLLKELTELRKEEEKSLAEERIKKEIETQQRAGAIKKAKREQKEERTSSSSTRITPNVIPSGMCGMPPVMDADMMAGLMSDTEIQEEMENPKAVAAFSDLMSEVGTSTTLVDYKGNKVDSATRDVLVHLVDNFEDHFSADECPSGNFVDPVNEWRSLGTDDTFKANDEGPGEKWYAPLYFQYHIEGKPIKSKYICLRGVYIELRPPVNKKGKIANNFGSSWINLYLPGPVLKRFSDKLKKNLGWSLRPNMFTRDSTTNLYSIAVKMIDTKPPSFALMSKGRDKAGNPTGRMFIQNKGTIPQIFSNPALRKLYKGTVLITANMNFVNPAPSVVGKVGDISQIQKSVKAKFTSKLIATRIVGPVDGINQIAFGGGGDGLTGV